MVVVVVSVLVPTVKVLVVRTTLVMVLVLVELTVIVAEMTVVVVVKVGTLMKPVAVTSTLTIDETVTVSTKGYTHNCRKVPGEHPVPMGSGKVTVTADLWLIIK